MIFGIGAQLLSQDYVIRERDILKVTVYEHPDLTLDLRVSGDGTITFPLIGTIKVSGMTEKEVQEKIRSMLADGYIVNPQVNVIVQEYKDYIYVTGEVKKPGAYQYEEGMTVLKAITLAGGFTEKASKRRIKVVRSRDNLDGTRGEKGNSSDENSDHTIEIRVKLEDRINPNDIIIVPESFF